MKERGGERDSKNFRPAPPNFSARIFQDESYEMVI